MELALRGEVDPVQGEGLEGEQAEGRGEWEARDPVRAPRENVCVPVVEPLLPTRRDPHATSGAVLSAGR
jgi:hypothetical protein